MWGRDRGGKRGREKGGEREESRERNTCIETRLKRQQPKGEQMKREEEEKHAVYR